MTPILLNAKDAARALGVREHQIYKLCEASLLRGATKAKGKWEIPSPAIREYENERRGKVPVELKTLKKVRLYILQHLSKVGEDSNHIGTAMLEIFEQPIIDDYSKEEIKKLEVSLRGCSRYTEEILAVLRRIDNDIKLAGYGEILEQGG